VLKLRHEECRWETEMKKAREVALAGVILLTTAVWGQTRAENSYHGAGVGHTGEITYPMNSATTGIVTLDVSVDATGTVQNVRVVRDVPPLTSAAQSAVQSWQFTPALVNGQPAAGTVRINVVFNPFNPSGVGLPSPPLQPANSSGAAATGDFSPAQVTAASYATYPPHTVMAGTVVLQVHVGSSGKVQGVIVVRGTGSLNGTAARAVKAWQFMPASYQGKTVASDVVVAYVFALPAAGTM
jgi:TonB family protein